MVKIPNAKRSPRIENGVLYWYEGDTFSINLKINLSDQDEEPIVIDGTTDFVEVEFINDRREIVKSFFFGKDTGNDIVDNSIDLVFDDTVTALFTKGRYKYNVFFNGENRTTIADNNVAVVG